MANSRASSFGHISNVLDRQITRIRRINYLNPDGTRDVSQGPIECVFDGAIVMRLESSSDGASLRLRVGEWVDPFAEPISDENRAFVRSSGKWTAYDVSEDRGYREMIGHSIRVTNLFTMNDLIIGLELTAGGVLLRAEVGADELVVNFSVE